MKFGLRLNGYNLGTALLQCDEIQVKLLNSLWNFFSNVVFKNIQCLCFVQLKYKTSKYWLNRIQKESGHMLLKFGRNMGI